MIDVKGHLGLLGRTATDKVTKLKGVVTSISFDLFGCIQATLNPGVQADGKLGEVFWFDVSRLVVSKDRVMEPPAFKLDLGPECKPTRH